MTDPLSDPASGPVSSIARGALVNLITRSSAVGLGLGITLVTARMGAERQGVFALFTAVESVLLAVCSGFGIAMARRISHHGQAPGGLVSATVLVCGALGVGLGVVVLAVSQVAGGAYAMLWLLACALPLTLLTPNLTGLWLGQGRMGPIGWVTVGTPLLTLLFLAAALLAGAPLSLLAVLAAWVAAKLAVSLLSLRAAARQAWGAPDWPALKGDAGFIATIALTNLIGLMNYKVDLFLVEHFLGLGPTGVYSIAVMVAELLWFLSASLSQAAFARVGTPDRAQAGATVVRVLHLSLLALVVCAPVLYGLAAWLLPALLGAAYEQALPVLALLLPGVLAFGAASALSAYFTNHAGRPLVPAAMAGLSLLINVALSVVLIPRLGMAGGAVATSVSYIVTIVWMLALFRAHAGLSWPTVLRPDGAQLGRDLMALRRVFVTSGARP